MFRLYNCLVNEHDAFLVALAALVCALSVFSGLKAYRFALASATRRWAWTGLAAGGLASGIWATHFIAMLAYNPPVPIGFTPWLTATSLALTLAATWAGLEIGAAGPARSRLAVLAGVTIGFGVAAMHFTGMAALELAGRLTWDQATVAVAVGLGTVLSATATWALHRFAGSRGLFAGAALLALAICGLHFIAMSAVTIVPDPSIAAPDADLDRRLLAWGITALAAAGIGAGVAVTTIEHLRGRIASQVFRLQAEIEERRRAEADLHENETRLIAHQTAIAELMRDVGMRNGTTEEATRHLMRALAQGLGVERAGFILLDEAGNTVVSREVYLAAQDRFLVPDGYGSAEHMAALKRSAPSEIVTVDDTATGHDLAEFRALVFERNAIRSVMHAPIIAHGDLVGFMTCANTSRTMSWRPEQRVFALSVASIAALVCERQQRLQVEAAARRNAERLAKQQTLLNELIGSEKVRGGQVGELLAQIASVLCRDMRVDRVSVRLFADAGIEKVHTEVFIAEEQRFVEVTRNASRKYPAFLAEAISQGPIVVSDCATDPLTAPIHATRLKPRRIRAMLHVPVRSEEALVGVIACSIYDRPHAWSAEDILLATSVANVVALAVERRLRLETVKRLQQANIAAQEASRAKTRFLANMSHEIRTPMNGVLGMADLLSRSGLNERQQRIASTITDSAYSLLAIINDILDISRIEGGKLTLDRQEFSLAVCLEDAVELLAEQAGKKSLDLNLYIDEAVRGNVTGDPVRLRQVLVNLIGNAIKFTSIGEVSVAAIPDPDQPAEAVRFMVRDTGIGIRPELQEKLFEPFTQADTSITRRFGGTGLGLSISRHLVELMGGQIGLESTPGEGALIWFVLPMAVDRTQAGVRSEPGTLAGRRVLVVDDRLTNREIVSSYMAASGAVIEAAENKTTAMAKLTAAAAAGRPFELALVDYVMDGGNGMELAHQIKGTAALGGLKVILLSSIAWSADIGDAQAAGILKVLHKPIRRTELVASAIDCLSMGRGDAGSGETASAVEAMPHDCRGLSVLVAEDNPVNQVVAEEYLSHLGCSVTIAENGLQAVAEIERARFDVVLMDCQMPELDGYSATERIRARERETGQPHLPIIAVTANAYEADRQRCLAAGMDAYVSKPYSQEQLAAAISNLLAARAQAGTAAQIDATPSSAAAPAPRPAEVQEPAIVALRPELREKLLGTYLDHAPGALAALSSALDEADGTAVALVAHSLKSSSANVGLSDLARLAADLETAGREGDVGRCRSLAAEFAARIGSVRDAGRGRDVAEAV